MQVDMFQSGRGEDRPDHWPGAITGFEHNQIPTPTQLSTANTSSHDYQAGGPSYYTPPSIDPSWERDLDFPATFDYAPAGLTRGVPERIRTARVLGRALPYGAPGHRFVPAERSLRPGENALGEPFLPQGVIRVSR